MIQKILDVLYPVVVAQFIFVQWLY